MLQSVNVEYGNGWFRAKKQLAELWNLNQAKKCHEKRQLYAAVVKNEAIPTCFIEVNGTYIGVGFLDRLLREYMFYSFNEVEPGRLFLTEVTFREFQGDSDSVTNGTSYYFKQSGTVRIVHEDFQNDALWEKENQIDISSNWEPYPEFGKYESICRENRDN